MEQLVPHRIIGKSELANDYPEAEIVRVTLKERFMPPKVFSEYASVEVIPEEGSSLLLFLGSIEEHSRYDTVQLSAGQVLCVTMDPFQWICIQKNIHGCTLSHAKRILPSLPHDSLPVLERNLRDAFAEESTITFPFKYSPPPTHRFEWKERINAMVHWYLQCAALDDSSFWSHPQLINWLEALTGLKLGYPRERPSWRRFQPGHYVILNDKYPQEAGLDLIYTLASCCGVGSGDSNWVYLDAESGEELLRVPCDQSGMMTLVYKTPVEAGEGDYHYPVASIKRFKQYWTRTGRQGTEYAIQMNITFPVLNG